MFPCCSTRLPPASTKLVAQELRSTLGASCGPDKDNEEQHSIRGCEQEEEPEHRFIHASRSPSPRPFAGSTPAAKIVSFSSDSSSSSYTGRLPDSRSLRSRMIDTPSP